MRNRINIFWGLAGIVVLGILGYSCYKWYDYENKYINIQKKLSQLYQKQQSLTPVDCMVLSRSTEAYLKCNAENAEYSQGYGNRLFSPRDYLLYCYIFAIRDENPNAACEFTSYYLMDVNDGKIPLDTAMMREIERLSMQVMHDSSFHADAMTKFLVASNLEDIYHGEYAEKYKDSVLYQQYCDTVAKYGKKL